MDHGIEFISVCLLAVPFKFPSNSKFNQHWPFLNVKLAEILNSEGTPNFLEYFDVLYIQMQRDGETRRN